MRVLYDHQIFDMQSVGGISRYFAELIKNFPSGIIPDISVKYTVNQYLKTIPILYNQVSSPPDYYRAFMGGQKFKGKKKLYTLKKKYFPEPDLSGYNKDLTIAALKKGAFDIFHPTYYDDYFLEYIGTKPFVLTVYDMIHEIYAEDFLFNTNNSIISRKKRELIQRAAKIITISENTRKDLATLFEVEPEKIRVTYLGSSLTLAASNTPLHNIPQKYFLFVGSRENYKNFYFFLYAVKKYLTQDSQLYLVCAGQKFSQPEKELIDSLDLTTQVIHFYADDTTLAYLYKNALAFVFPSLYEGFGIPVLEAFSCGCPVLLSKGGSLVEVGGDAAIYFEPKDTVSIKEAIHKILHDPSVRQQMIARGFEQLKKFSWQQTAQSTFQIYNDILTELAY